MFLGGFEHSSDSTELVYNTQTPSLFVDLRIPRLRSACIASHHASLSTLSDTEIRCFARQHCFSGYSLLGGTAAAPDVTRHHIIDWNFVGRPRTRPNRWRVEMAPKDVPSPLAPAFTPPSSIRDQTERRRNADVWKEWSFAKDHFGQHLYVRIAFWVWSITPSAVRVKKELTGSPARSRASATQVLQLLVN